MQSEHAAYGWFGEKKIPRAFHMRFAVPVALMLLLALVDGAHAMVVPPFQPGIKIRKEHSGTTVMYAWKDFLEEKSIRSKISLKICRSGVCKTVAKPPKLDKLTLDESGAYVVGLSYSRDNQEQLFVWNKFATPLIKKVVDCEKISSCCFINDGPLVFWFAPDAAVEAVFDKGVLKLRIPRFKEMQCDSKESGHSVLSDYFEMNVPIPSKH